MVKMKIAHLVCHRNSGPMNLLVSALKEELRHGVSRGETTGQAVRAIGVTEQTYYRWRREYGGMGVDQARRLKELEKENLRLRKAVSDLTLDKLILAEAAKGNF